MRKLSLVVLSTLAAAAVAQAGHAAGPQLNVQPGLWAQTTATKISGSMIPPAELARLPPAQRAKMEAAVQESMGAMARPQTRQVCVTQKQLAESFKPDAGPNCTSTVTSSSAQALHVHETCGGEGARSVGDFVIQASNPHAITGQGHFTMTRGGSDMKADMTFQGQWLAASCGNVH
jgi:hypothetical protein